MSSGVCKASSSLVRLVLKRRRRVSAECVDVSTVVVSTHTVTVTVECRVFACSAVGTVLIALTSEQIV